MKNIFSLLSLFLVMSSYLFAQPGTVINIEVINNSSPSSGYYINITLHQTSASPSSGNLTFFVSGGTTHTETLEFEATDICVDYVKCTYEFDPNACPQSAEIFVNCFCNSSNYIDKKIAPENEWDENCNLFKYYNCEYNYGTPVNYYFEITPY